MPLPQPTSSGDLTISAVPTAWTTPDPIHGSRNDVVNNNNSINTVATSALSMLTGPAKLISSSTSRKVSQTIRATAAAAYGRFPAWSTTTPNINDPKPAASASSTRPVVQSIRVNNDGRDPEENDDDNMDVSMSLGDDATSASGPSIELVRSATAPTASSSLFPAGGASDLYGGAANGLFGSGMGLARNFGRADDFYGLSPLEDSGAAEIAAKKAESEENLRASRASLAGAGGVKFLASLPVQASAAGFKPVLALDLDETLIHSAIQRRREPDFSIEVVQNHDWRTRENFHVYKRPGVDAFLLAMAQHYTLVVFTAGIKEYAAQILDQLERDVGCMVFAARLYRDSCTEVRTGGTTFAKDMKRVCSDLRKVVLVDNTPGCFGIQPENGMLIKSFYTDEKDRHLPRLGEFLLQYKDADDFRNVAREWNVLG
ncbi:HAD-like domain-containing protein [Blastocladiella britannica]|nr:HAD-like domain-containing protein [Blastocladiella britannica]